ncbi:hypothetical protein GGR58DRAFT_469482 [Xylaria digitata]|nr:hypothetical protein GGR58DRAFT_469482 [Xylaria digitata]
MMHAPARKSRVEIPLPSKPRHYRPGDGPPLAPVRLSLDHDTGAFIVDKRVRPGNPIHGELKLELYYIVGWPDLPAARVAILATKILDYVSPRTLEDWEYKSSLEKDEEEKRVVAQKARQTERTQARMSSIPGTGASTPSMPGQKKRGRPSKAKVLARHIAQQASFGDDELANVPLPPARTDGPSLSTPQKKLAQAAADLEDLEETDTNEAISRQLQDGSENDSDSPVAEGLDESNKLGTGTGFTSLNSFLPNPSSRGYAEFLTPNLTSPVQQDPTLSKSPIPISLRPNSKKTISRRKTQLTTPVPVPSYPKQAWKKTSALVKKTITPVPPLSYRPSGAKLPRQAHVGTITPVPAPSYPAPKPKSPKKATFTPIPAPVNPIPKPKALHEVIFTPIPPPPCPHPLQQSSKYPAKVAYTPIPPPSLQMTYENPSKAAYTRISQPTPSTPNATIKPQEQNSLTPASHGLKKRPTGAEAKIESNDPPHTPSKSGTPIVKASNSRKRKLPWSEEEQEWEVKRLEGDKVLETGGELVRYFKIRWAGNWPTGQNPTWEPEGNISHVLVQQYLKDKAAGIAQSGSYSTAIKKPSPT